jgi:hypothetical protein
MEWYWYCILELEKYKYISQVLWGKNIPISVPIFSSWKLLLDKELVRMIIDLKNMICQHFFSCTNCCVSSFSAVCFEKSFSYCHFSMLNHLICMVCDTGRWVNYTYRNSTVKQHTIQYVVFFMIICKYVWDTKSTFLLSTCIHILLSYWLSWWNHFVCRVVEDILTKFRICMRLQIMCFGDPKNHQVTIGSNMWY